MKKIEKLQVILIFILTYLLCTREKNKYDEIVILILGLVTFVKNIRYKEYFELTNKIIYLMFVWIILITVSFIKMRLFYEKGDYIILYRNIILDNFILFFILIQININKLIKIERIYNVINLLSLYSIYKGVIFIRENGFFIRGYAWGNPNFYSMLLGIFMIVSFISSLYEQNKIYKILYIILNIVQFFMMINIGQSRNVCFAIMISYFIVLVLFFYKRIKLKLFLKILSIIFIIILLFLYFSKVNNLRITKISLDELLNNPRILIWKKALFEEKFNIFFGKGFAYYTMNKFKDTVGVTIWALHNDTLEFLITQGIFSMFCYWGFFIYSLKSLLKDFFIEFKIETLISLIVIIYFFQIGMLDLPFYHKRIAQFTFFFLGIAMNKNLIKIKKEKDNEKNNF